MVNRLFDPGDIFQFHVFGQKAVVLSSIEVALDLLDSRGMLTINIGNIMTEQYIRWHILRPSNTSHGCRTVSSTHHKVSLVYLLTTTISTEQVGELDWVTHGVQIGLGSENCAESSIITLDLAHHCPHLWFWHKKKRFDICLGGFLLIRRTLSIMLASTSHLASDKKIY
jgi:hypothetical protein